MNIRHLVPRALRHRVSAELARMHSRRLDRDLMHLALGSDTIVAGPWLGEVGFELLYWVPFLRWFATTFHVAPERLLIVSRGGTASWYRPFAARYRETFDYLTPEQFRRVHDERVAANGEQKQTRVLAFEHDLLAGLTRDVRSRRMLHPSSMYALFNPFWWGHLSEDWVHGHARYCPLQADTATGIALPREPYTAVKFYFNDCFPATDANRAFIRATLRTLASRGPVISLATGLHLDDHGAEDTDPIGVHTLPAEMRPQDNLAVQSAVLAGAAAFVGTYGGFSYLGPFLGVRTTAFYADPEGYSQRHLRMAQSAFHRMGRQELLDVRALAGHDAR